MRIRPSCTPARVLPFVMAIAMPALALLIGCADTHGAAPTLYDLGVLTPPAAVDIGTGRADAPQTGPAQTLARTPVIVTVADVVGAPWLDSQRMYYRLAYQNGQQPRPYADSRWSMPPPQLLGQRIKARLAQLGAVVLSAADGALNVPVLRIDADDFSQRFSGPAHSAVHVALRASLFDGRLLIAQKSFDQVRPAPSADAAGGASALAAATDSVIGEMAAWIAALPLKR